MATEPELEKKIPDDVEEDATPRSLAEAEERIAHLLNETSVTLGTSTLRKARERFSTLFQEVVESRRPQRITRRGGEAVVVIDEMDFWALMSKAPQEIPMVDYFQAVASVEAEKLEPLARATAREIAEL